MKKLSYLFVAASAALSMQACHSSKDSKAKADSMNNARDTTKATTVKKDTTPVVMTVNADDAKFATAAANGGMAEVNLGKLAQEKGTSQKVKDFGAMMVTDHSKANDELKALAKNKGIALPLVVGADEQKEYDELSKKSAADFDKAYVSKMIDGHKKAVSLFEDAAKNCKDPDLKAFATNTLPTVKAHLELIKDIDKILMK